MWQGKEPLQVIGLEGAKWACAAAKRHEFMLTLTPLYVIGGTGSPVNPVAIL